MSDRFRTPAIPNPWALVGLVVSTGVAAAGLFALPSLVDAGLSVTVAFFILCVVEFLAAVGVLVSARALYRRPTE